MEQEIDVCNKQSNNVVLLIDSDREARWAARWLISKIYRTLRSRVLCDLLSNLVQHILVSLEAFTVVQHISSATLCAKTQTALTAHIVTTVVAVVSAAVCAITTLDAAHIVFCIFLAWCATILHFGAHCEKGNE